MGLDLDRVMGLCGLRTDAANTVPTATTVAAISPDAPRCGDVGDVGAEQAYWTWRKMSSTLNHVEVRQPTTAWIAAQR